MWIDPHDEAGITAMYGRETVHVHFNFLKSLRVCLICLFFSFNLKLTV